MSRHISSAHSDDGTFRSGTVLNSAKLRMLTIGKTTGGSVESSTSSSSESLNKPPVHRHPSLVDCRDIHVYLQPYSGATGESKRFSRTKQVTTGYKTPDFEEIFKDPIESPARVIKPLQFRSQTLTSSDSDTTIKLAESDEISTEVRTNAHIGLMSNLRSLSMSNLNDRCDLSKLKTPPSATGNRPFNAPELTQILPYLYVGKMEAAFNTHILCENKIEYLVDLSDMKPSDVPNYLNNKAACFCGAKSHARTTISVAIPNVGDLSNSVESVLTLFGDVNNFVETGRSHNKAALIYGGKFDVQKCLLVLTQYLMLSFRTDSLEAYRYVRLKWPNLAIALNGQYEDYLDKWFKVLQNHFRKHPNSGCNNTPFKKVAWN